MRLDDEETWPAHLRDMLDRHFDLLSDYEKARQARARRREEGDIEALIERWENPYGEGRDRVVAGCDVLLADVDLVGYHCTRLLDREIEGIRKVGLEPLSLELVERRISCAVELGLLRQEHAHQLRAKNQVADANRAGMLWFVFSRALLSDEGGTIRLFRSWGGEAVYNLHEADLLIGRALRSIGSPCIVEAAAPASQIETFLPLGERIASAYLDRRGVSTRAGAEVGGYVRWMIPGDRILRVIHRDEPDFDALTECSVWWEELS